MIDQKSYMQYANKHQDNHVELERASREAAYREQTLHRLKERSEAEREAKEAWERIPEVVKLADAMNITASLLEDMPDFVQDSDMWFVKTALVNCTAALQFLLNAEIQRGDEQDAD